MLKELFKSIGKYVGMGGSKLTPKPESKTCEKQRWQLSEGEMGRDWVFWSQ